MGFKQCLCHQFQSGMAGNQLPDAAGERAFGGLADLQAKTAKHTAQAVLDVAQLRLQQLARRQNRTRLLRLDRLAVHRTEPAEPHQLGDPTGVVAVRLHRHRLEGIADVPRLQKLNRKARLPQRRVQPLRQRTCFESNPLQRHPSERNQAISASGSLATFASRKILPAPSTTHTLELSKDTSICIMVHGRPSMMLGAGLPNSGY